MLHEGSAPAIDRHSPVVVLVVDDEPAASWALKLLLSRASWVERCVTADSPEAAVRHARQFQPHVVLLSAAVGDASLARNLQRLGRRTRIVMHCHGAVPLATQRRHGAVGAVSRHAPLDQLLRFLREVSADEWTAWDDGPEEVALSEREERILSLMARGATNREIGLELHLSPNTIKDNTVVLYRKLGVRNRAEAVSRYGSSAIATAR